MTKLLDDAKAAGFEVDNGNIFGYKYLNVNDELAKFAALQQISIEEKTTLEELEKITNKYNEAMKVLNQIADGKRKTRERNLAYSFVKFIETMESDQSMKKGNL